MTTQEKIEVMQAYAEGRKIQMRPKEFKEWDDWGISEEPEWDWCLNEYRIKPESTYRPYKDTEEMIADFRKKVGMGYPKLFLPSVWVKRKDGTDFAKLITEFGYICVWLSVIQEGVSLKVLFQDYTYLDGSLCGMKEDCK
jgi:hypothetical protein